MQIELNPQELESLIEAMDCLKTKIAFTKSLKNNEKTERLREAEALEQKLRQLDG